MFQDYLETMLLKMTGNYLETVQQSDFEKVFDKNVFRYVNDKSKTPFWDRNSHNLQ